MTAGSATTVTSKISRECITCDAKDCSNRNPMYKCSRCHTVYYCSKDCQRKHWKGHKHDCVPIEEMRASTARLDETMPENTIPQFQKGDVVQCGICLQNASLANPVVLPTCQHAFCYLCIKKWRHRETMSRPSGEKLCCPCCSVEIPPDVSFVGVDDQLCERASELAKRAERRDQGSEEQKAMCEEALSIINRLIEKKEMLNYLSIKAKICLVGGEEHTGEVMNLVAKIFQINREERQKLMSLNPSQVHILSEGSKKGEFRHTTFKRHSESERIRMMTKFQEESRGVLSNMTDTNLIMATALEQSKTWYVALTAYDDLNQQIYGDATTPSQQRQISMGMSRCYYELGLYSQSIDIGKTVLKDTTNRQFPGIHKYVALSLKASGELDAAIDVMNRAVLCETPWDDKNKQEALNLYNELRALKASGWKCEKINHAKENDAKLRYLRTLRYANDDDDSHYWEQGGGGRGGRG